MKSRRAGLVFQSGCSKGHSQGNQRQDLMREARHQEHLAKPRLGSSPLRWGNGGGNHLLRFCQTGRWALYTDTLCFLSSRRRFSACPAICQLRLHFPTWGQNGIPQKETLRPRKKGTQPVSTTLCVGFRGRNLILFLIYSTFPGKR